MADELTRHRTFAPQILVHPPILMAEAGSIRTITYSHLRVRKLCAH